jgi:DNA-binding transcriptional MocR family regulator
MSDMPRRTTSDDSFVYEQLIAEISQLVAIGTLRPGDRLPSVRQMSGQRSVSIPTVLKAYSVLEARRIIGARPKSGFYVLSQGESRAPKPAASPLLPVSGEVTTSDLIMRCLEMVADPTLIPLGTALPDPDLLPGVALARSLGRVARRSATLRGPADLGPSGALPLRHEIARRAARAGSTVTADDVVVTCGCAEAITLCLRALTRPGDTVAVESPTYFGTLQAIKALGLRALEIPVDPETGISLEVLGAALERGGVAAIVVTPTVHNPLGSVMPDDNKRRLVELLATHGVPAVEDDTYGDLSFAADRPRSLQSFDRRGLVLYCGSFSKTLAPTYRLGWTIPRDHRDLVLNLKLSTTVATSVPTQLAIADYLAAGGYDAYLRRLRRTFETNVDRVIFELRARLGGARVTRPAGGYLLWVQLPEGVDTVEVQRTAIARGLSVAPGPAFSASGSYSNYVRINAGYRWSERTGDAIDVLATLIADSQRR